MVEELAAPRPAAAISATGAKRIGRPLAKDAAASVEHNKPWIADGMSHRTWYRRQKEKR